MPKRADKACSDSFWPWDSSPVTMARSSRATVSSTSARAGSCKLMIRIQNLIQPA